MSPKHIDLYGLSLFFTDGADVETRLTSMYNSCVMPGIEPFKQIAIDIILEVFGLGPRGSGGTREGPPGGLPFNETP